MPKLERPIFRAVVALALTTTVAASTTACIGVRTKMRVPDCATVTGVEGEHLRYPRSVGFDHGADFALTKTRVVVEHEDGSRTTAVTTNGVPDVFHLFGGGLMLLGGGALFALYAVDVSRTGEPFNPETFLLAPLGVIVGAAGIYLGLTGWSPGGELLIPSKCGASAQDSFGGLPPPGGDEGASGSFDDADQQSNGSEQPTGEYEPPLPDPDAPQGEAAGQAPPPPT